MKTSKRTISLIIAALFMLSFTTCRTIEEPKAIIYVYEVDAAGNEWPVNNAEVWLDPPESASQPDLLNYASQKRLTNLSGEVEYEFKYEGIVQVKAEHSETCGQGVIILSYDNVYNERIRLSACYVAEEEEETAK